MTNYIRRRIKEVKAQQDAKEKKEEAQQDAQKKQEEAQKKQEEFEALDPASLAGMTNKALAQYHAENHPEGVTPQYLLAEHEWQSRLIARQVHATYRVAYIGIIGAVLSALLGVGLGWYLSKLSSEKPPSSTQSSIANQEKQKDAVHTPEKPTSLPGDKTGNSKPNPEKQTQK